MVHGLCRDDRQQAVLVGDLLGVARLQRRQRRQELALLVHKAQDIGHVAEWQLVVEGVKLVVVRSFGAPARQCCTGLVVVEMCQFTRNPAKLAGLEGYGLEIVERIPLVAPTNDANRRYLETKRTKMGHLLTPENEQDA